MGRVEDLWCAGLVPPSKTPSYDWDLHRWVRAMEREDGDRRRFYHSARWLRLRAKVLEDFRHESLMELSMSPARYVRANTVHHVLRVHEHPGWALSEWAVDGGRVVRNLVPLSPAAHNVAHGRRLPPQGPKPQPLTDERW